MFSDIKLARYSYSSNKDIMHGFSETLHDKNE